MNAIQTHITNNDPSKVQSPFMWGIIGSVDLFPDFVCLQHITPNEKYNGNCEVDWLNLTGNSKEMQTV